MDVSEWGAPDLPPLLFVHGLGAAGADTVAAAAPRWAACGFRVIAPSLPGWGASPALPAHEYRPSVLVKRLCRLFDGPAVVVGYSWGGMLGVHFPAERLRGLVLVDGGYWDPQPPPAEAIVSPHLAHAVGGIATEPPAAAWPALAASGLPVLLLTREDAVEEDVAVFAAAVPQAEIRRIPAPSTTSSAVRRMRRST
jgi:pimeloyl-ACP methyl ester carboxylesterase